MEWTEVVEKVKNSVILIYSLGANDQITFSDSSVNIFEDFFCVRCDGLGGIPCENKGCRNGMLSKQQTYVVSRNLLGNPIYGTKTIKTKCPKCDKKGLVPCPVCKGLRVRLDDLIKMQNND